MRADGALGQSHPSIAAMSAFRRASTSWPNFCQPFLQRIPYPVWPTHGPSLRTKIHWTRTTLLPCDVIQESSSRSPDPNDFAERLQTIDDIDTIGDRHREQIRIG